MEERTISSLMLALTVSVGAFAQDAVIVESENFNAATLPAGWVTFGNDPVDPLASSQVASDGWIFGETDYLIGFLGCSSITRCKWLCYF